MSHLILPKMRRWQWWQGGDQTCCVPHSIVKLPPLAPNTRHPLAHCKQQLLPYTSCTFDALDGAPSKYP